MVSRLKTVRKLVLGIAVTLAASVLGSCGPSGDAAAGSAAAVPAAAQVKEVTSQQLQQWMAAGQPLTLIDVREDDEWQAGHAAAALHISRWIIATEIATAAPDKTARIVLYCKGGVRSAAAAVLLQKQGYTNVYSLAGGFKTYQAAGLPVR
jgi:rhodanese-related sulfurtransferase